MKNTSGNKNRIRRSRLIIILALIIICFPCSVHMGRSELLAGDSGDDNSVNVVKAAYICNFLKYVEWPEWSFQNETVPISIYITQGRFGRFAMEELRLKKVKGRRLKLREWNCSNETLPDNCQVVYIDESCTGNLASLIQIFEKKNILSIGCLDGFAEMGGIIELIRIDGNIRFTINTAAAQRSGIKLESQLLRLARIIEE